MPLSRHRALLRHLSELRHRFLQFSLLWVDALLRIILRCCSLRVSPLWAFAAPFSSSSPSSTGSAGCEVFFALAFLRQLAFCLCRLAGAQCDKAQEPLQEPHNVTGNLSPLEPRISKFSRLSRKWSDSPKDPSFRTQVLGPRLD